MNTLRQVAIPTLVRIKPGALDRIGIYARRNGVSRVCVFHSEGLPSGLIERLTSSLDREEIQTLARQSVVDNSIDTAQALFKQMPSRTQAVLGLGGGKALDIAKYVSFLAGVPYFSVPTSLSNDGFCSPQASLAVDGCRRSLPAVMPYGVVIDTEICLAAPEILWLSGVGDLVAKFTAVADWKLAYHVQGTAFDDFAALLSDATVHQFLAMPVRSLEGIRLLATALMLNGVAMGIAGTSRPASGSEHLISHALDNIGGKPCLHGLQVGVATYIVSLLQKQHSEAISRVFETTGFWQAIQKEPFSRSSWIAAARKAPSVKQDFYTVLASRDCLPEIEALLATDPFLSRCFVN